MQAICQAVKDTLTLVLMLHPTHIFLWLYPIAVADTLLTLAPYSSTHITYNTHALIGTYLETADTHTIDIWYYD